MIDFSAAKAITIPEGSIANIQVGGSTIWRKHAISFGDLLYELSEDRKHYVVAGVQDGVTKTSFTFQNTVNGLPVSDVAENAFAGLSGLTICINGEIDLADAPWGTTTPNLYIDGIRYRQTTTTSRKPDYVVATPNSDFKGGVVNILGRIGSIVVSEINSSTFSGYTNITEVIIPAEIRWIETSIFRNCTNLKKVTFKGKPETTTTSVFTGCTNLTDIYVPWAEGEVANAPWGAPNATIHYNYVEE